MLQLLSLSPELHLSIISHLRLSDKSSLQNVCRTFSNLLVLDVPFEQLRAARKKKSILLHENATQKGQLGFAPFIVTTVRKDFESTHPRILLDIYYPKFMHEGSDDEDEIEDEDEDDWEINIHMQNLNLCSDKGMSEDRRVESVDYEMMRGKLLRASAGLLRTRFVCPECGNSRSVCPGCGGFSRRFSDLFTSCGWPMPCPVCIGYGVAYDAKYIQDDQEELDELWKEIDAMLAKEKGADAKSA
ncbi:hypothetical protein B0H19DRAFT_552864 [Mycena capillaripes]|nr:hypothetical protein B0H19DRAFT_552864 [Mycena capillaripes]